MTLPLVSCLMPTSVRLDCVAEALAWFLKQDYPARELLILNDGPGRMLTTDQPGLRIVDQESGMAGLSEIRVGREMRSLGRVTLNRIYGTLTFHPELWPEGPISFDDWDLRPDAHYLKVAKYIQAAGRDVPLKELTAHMGLYYQTVRYHAHRAVLAGLIEPAERLDNGWRPVQTAAVCE